MISVPVLNLPTYLFKPGNMIMDQVVLYEYIARVHAVGRKSRSYWFTLTVAAINPSMARYEIDKRFKRYKSFEVTELVEHKVIARI